MSTCMSILVGCLFVLVSVHPAYAQADPEGTLYIYVDSQGEELTSTTPLEGMDFVERVSPSGRTVVQTSKGAGSLEDRMSPYLEMVYRIAPEHGVDPVFVLSIIYAESHFDPSLTSTAGAMGLMQIMPSNAKRFGADDAYDPAQNITAGCMLLARLQKRYDGDVALILAAYSAGDVHVKNYGGVPPFSIKYIARVVRAHAKITAHLTSP